MQRGNFRKPNRNVQQKGNWGGMPKQERKRQFDQWVKDQKTGQPTAENGEQPQKEPEAQETTPPPEEKEKTGR